MRRSSIVLLALSFLIAAVLVSIYVPLLRESQRDFTEQDAGAMLGRLQAALNDKDVDRVMAFAAPDAQIAGQTVKQIRQYLQRGFAAARYLDVTFSDMRYSREGDTVTLDVHVRAGERPTGATDLSTVYYDNPVQFTLQRRDTAQMGGLFYTYSWLVTRVTAEKLPNADFGF